MGVCIVDPGAVERFQGKPKRIVDLPDGPRARRARRRPSARGSRALPRRLRRRREMVYGLAIPFARGLSDGVGSNGSRREPNL